MKTEDEIREFVRKLVLKGWRNPSAITLASYYKPFENDWRFDKMRAFSEQEIKTYSQELLRNKK